METRAFLPLMTLYPSLPETHRTSAMLSKLLETRWQHCLMCFRASVVRLRSRARSSADAVARNQASDHVRSARRQGSCALYNLSHATNRVHYTLLSLRSGLPSRLASSARRPLLMRLPDSSWRAGCFPTHPSGTISRSHSPALQSAELLRFSVSTPSRHTALNLGESPSRRRLHPCGSASRTTRL